MQDLVMTQQEYLNSSLKKKMDDLIKTPVYYYRGYKSKS